MKNLLLTTAIILAGCQKPKDTPPLADPTLEAKDLYAYYSERLSRDFLEDGQLISRDPSGAAEHVGDSLIWTGVAVGVLPCDKASGMAERIARRLVDNAGELVRFEPLPEEFKGGNEVSFDGITGVYFGFSRLFLRCGYDASYESAFRARQSYTEGINGRLHRNVAQTIPSQFTYAEQLLQSRMGLAGEPSKDRLYVLEQEIAAWMLAVKTNHAACFRANLGWMYIAIVEALGQEISPIGRRSICSASNGLQLPQIDNWCGRGGMHEFVDSFVENQWEYKLQRCSGWEGEADGDGLSTPSLDLLLALTELYKL